MSFKITICVMKKNDNEIREFNINAKCVKSLYVIIYNIEINTSTLLKRFVDNKEISIILVRKRQENGCPLMPRHGIVL